MKKFLFALVGAVMTFSAVSVRAEEYGTKDEAVALVNKAIEFVKANGKEKALEEFNKSESQFIDRDLYVIAADAEEGTRLSHPYKPALVGKNVFDAKDIDGKAYGEEIMEIAQGAGEGWVSYKFTDPKTQKIGDKETYVKVVDGLIIYCGVYKQ